MEIINLTKKQSKKNPLKRSMTGFEIEFFVTNENNTISYKGYWLAKKLKKMYPGLEITKECGKSMIEFGCYPGINTFNPALDMITTIEKALKVAKENKLKFYPFSTYPGKMMAKFTPDTSGKYGLQEKIFGKEKFGLATKVIGFHQHYTLPKGLFDPEKKKLKLLIESKLKRSLINSYNFLIAIDPAVTLLTQSSPFFNRELRAKDTRILLYRGGSKLKAPEGIYNKYQMFGALPPYKQTETDLIRSLSRRAARWKRIIRKTDSSIDIKEIYPYALDISWNPVKINKHGTLELRGMDSNLLSIMLAVSALIKSCLKKIQREFIEVIPADLGINTPFKTLKGIIFIPPHTYVREKLQRAEAYEGFDNDELYEYTKRFVRFAKKFTPKFYYPLIAKLEKMISQRESISDKMINYAKRKGLVTKKDTISKRSVILITEHFSKMFEKDLKETKRIVRIIAKKHKAK